MNKLLLTLSIAAFGGLLCAGPTLAQAPNAQSVTMKAGPSLEIAHDDIVILQWVTNNPAVPTIILLSHTMAQIPVH